MKIIISGNESVFDEMIDLGRELNTIDDLNIEWGLVVSLPPVTENEDFAEKLKKLEQTMLDFIDQAHLFILHNKKVEENEVKEGFIDEDNLDYLARAIEQELPIIYTHPVSTSHLKPPEDYKWDTTVIKRERIPKQISKLKQRQFGLKELLS